MSSILIKDVEMPKNCGECRIKSAIYCELWRLVRSVNLDRHRKCPIATVPPHGRLGDLDRLESGLRLMAKYQDGERQQGILGCCETIRLAKTIIPAEE